VADEDARAVEAALRRLMSEIEAGGYAARGHRLTSDDAYLEARTVLALFDTFQQRGEARRTVALVDVLRPLVAACERHDYRDSAGAALNQTTAFNDAAAAVSRAA
jgi:hypothetical protein